jgi:glucose/arabinose dehydrogenase
VTLSWRLVLLADIPDNAFNHNGGTLRFGPDGMLYASLGEDADPCGAQDFTILKGCILRLKVDALADTFGFTVPKPDLVPPDNPFVTNPNNNAKLTFAKGLRNPFRFHIDPADGHLYIADVGQNIWEEIDECVGGENFGWPQYEGSVAYSGYPGTCPAAGAKFPIATYNRSAFGSSSIISATVYHPVLGGLYSFPASYNGAYFYAEYYWVSATSGAHQRRLAVRAECPGQPNANDWATATTNPAPSARMAAST